MLYSSCKNPLVNQMALLGIEIEKNVSIYVALMGIEIEKNMNIYVVIVGPVSLGMVLDSH